MAHQSATVTNEEIVERVMRMGIEGRAHSLDKLHDLARQQLKKRVVQGDLSAWMQQETKFGFMDVNGVLTVVRVDDPSTVRIVEWRSPTWPLLERLH